MVVDIKFTPKELWQAIILYGLNQATYKIALGKTLIELASEGTNRVSWEELATRQFKQYVERLESNKLPQQSNPSRLTVLERAVASFKAGNLSEGQAIQLVAESGLNDVVPRFQTIGNNKSIVSNQFYEFQLGKSINLHDPLFDIIQSNVGDLEAELDARWSLLEGAFSLNHGSWELSNDIRETYLVGAVERKTLTDNIPFLQGYQGNVCFYCGEELDKSVHVDHVLPRQVVNHDEVWNLVLSHDLCNLNKSDSLVGLHYIEKLITRNENIMGSNHPWKKKISDALGKKTITRRKATLAHYERVKTVLNGRYWEGHSSYNRENDPFFKKLITQLNN
jgi:hypothetical protein